MSAPACFAFSHSHDSVDRLECAHHNRRGDILGLVNFPLCLLFTTRNAMIGQAGGGGGGLSHGGTHPLSNYLPNMNTRTIFFRCLENRDQQALRLKSSTPTLGLPQQGEEEGQGIHVKEASAFLKTPGTPPPGGGGKAVRSTMRPPPYGDAWRCHVGVRSLKKPANVSTCMAPRRRVPGSACHKPTCCFGVPSVRHIRMGNANVGGWVRLLCVFFFRTYRRIFGSKLWRGGMSGPDVPLHLYQSRARAFTQGLLVLKTRLDSPHVGSSGWQTVGGGVRAGRVCGGAISVCLRPSLDRSGQNVSMVQYVRSSKVRSALRMLIYVPDQHASDQHASDQHASDQHASDQHASDQHASDQHASDQHASDQHASDQHASDQHASDQHASDQHASDQHASDQHASDQHASDQHASDQHASDQHASDQHASDQHASDQHASDQHASDQHASDQHASDQHASDQHASDQHASDQHASSRRRVIVRGRGGGGCM